MLRLLSFVVVAVAVVMLYAAMSSSAQAAQIRSAMKQPFSAGAGFVAETIDIDLR